MRTDVETVDRNARRARELQRSAAVERALTQSDTGIIAAGDRPDSPVEEPERPARRGIVGRALRAFGRRSGFSSVMGDTDSAFGAAAGMTLLGMATTANFGEAVHRGNVEIAGAATDLDRSQAEIDARRAKYDAVPFAGRLGYNLGNLVGGLLPTSVRGNNQTDFELEERIAGARRARGFSDSLRDFRFAGFSQEISFGARFEGDPYERERQQVTASTRERNFAVTVQEATLQRMAATPDERRAVTRAADVQRGANAYEQFAGTQRVNMNEAVNLTRLSGQNVALSVGAMGGGATLTARTAAEGEISTLEAERREAEKERLYMDRSDPMAPVLRRYKIGLAKDWNERMRGASLRAFAADRQVRFESDQADLGATAAEQLAGGDAFSARMTQLTMGQRAALENANPADRPAVLRQFGAQRTYAYRERANVLTGLSYQAASVQAADEGQGFTSSLIALQGERATALFGKSGQERARLEDLYDARQNLLLREEGQRRFAYGAQTERIGAEATALTQVSQHKSTSAEVTRVLADAREQLSLINEDDPELRKARGQAVDAEAVGRLKVLGTRLSDAFSTARGEQVGSLITVGDQWAKPMTDELKDMVAREKDVKAIVDKGTTGLPAAGIRNARAAVSADQDKRLGELSERALNDDLGARMAAEDQNDMEAGVDAIRRAMEEGAVGGAKAKAGPAVAPAAGGAVGGKAGPIALDVGPKIVELLQSMDGKLENVGRAS